MNNRALHTVIFFLTLASTGLADWHLQWTRKLPARKPAWEHTQRMPRDVGYHPVVAGGLVLVGCEHNGAVLAFDAKTGNEKWRFYTNGPIRVAPVADEQRVLVGSDDGLLYSLDHQGKLLWKHRGGRSNRKVIGHERIISAWPVCARPVLEKGIVYSVAGYWPVDGIFVQALEVTTGKVAWTNGALQTRPYGSLRIQDKKLILSGHPKSGVLSLQTGVMLPEKAPKKQPALRPSAPGVKGNVTGWSQSKDYLAVGTTTGITVLGKTKGKPLVSPMKREPAPRGPLAGKIFARTKMREGYCLVAGLTNGELIAGLVQGSQLHVVAIDADAEKVHHIRQQLDRQGCFDTHRLDVLVADPASEALPPYFANLILSEQPKALPKVLREMLRPYGGTWLTHNGKEIALERRPGALPGSSDWQQEFCNAANTLASRDQRVQAPLGLLWYGGPAAQGRFYYDGFVDHQSGHGLNPQPVPAQIVEGRMILQAQGLLVAVDVYTGRVLWEAQLPKAYSFGGPGGGLGIHSRKHPKPWAHPEALKYEVPPTHHCRALGFNSVSLPDGIYVCASKHLLRFDPTDGSQKSKWKVPIGKAVEDLCWGGIRASDDLLICTAYSPRDLIDAQAGHDGNGGDWAGDRMPMRYLLALDRHTGKLLWSRTADWGFLNRSGVALGRGKVFCVDLITAKVHQRLQGAKRKLPADPPMLYALDLKTGKEAWKRPLDVYVQNLVCSEKRGLLVVPCRNLMEWSKGQWVDRSVDVRRGKRNKNAPGRMRALNCKDGKIVWDVEESAYHTPQVVLDDLIVDRWGFTYDLGTGKRHKRPSPLTGEPETWSFHKSGCNHLVACENLVTWRCAFYDLKHQSGAMKLIGMDSGCSPTLLPANGVLAIPNFGTHHKRNRMTAMALIHRPKNVLWTNYNTSREKSKVLQPTWIRHVGYNFGAPGDRFDTKGNLWLQVTPRNRAGVTFAPKEARWLLHAPEESGSWITTSAVTDVTSLTLPTQVGGKPRRDSRRFVVRLYFAEIETVKEGERVFSVDLEGKTVLTDLDVIKEARGRHKVLIREVRNVEIQGMLDVQLKARKGQPLLNGVELLLQK